MKGTSRSGLDRDDPRPPQAPDAGHARISRRGSVQTDRVTTRSEGLRVLVVDPSERGGIARYTERLVAALREQGVTALLAAPGRSADRGLELKARRWGPDVDALGRVRLYALRLRELPPVLASLRRAVVRAAPDLVHFQAEVVPGIDHRVLGRLRRRAGVVLTVHDALSMGGRAEVDPDEQRRWRQADAVIVHSEQSRAVVAAHAPAVPVHVVPVDLNLASAVVSRSEARSRLGLGDGPIALVLGFLRPYKGLGLLAAAWPSVVRAMPEARLMLVGEAQPSEELDQLSALEGVELRAGFLPDEEVDFWAAAADVVVMPYDRGSHSGVLHRALAVATPVLGSPPLAEEVERTGAGRVVSLESEAWSRAMLAALGPDPIPAPVQSCTGRTAAETVAVYRDVLFRRARSNGHGSGGPG
jgi:glycosyltransferase involved in cell wall biosynthesis